MTDYDRPTKNSAKDVIDYEIVMLEYCARRVLQAPTHHLTEREYIVALEAFLLHFRILLEFFGKPNARFDDNLYFQQPATYGGQPGAMALETTLRMATELDARWGEKLNKFLAHPTSKRYQDSRSWPVEQMRAEMRRLIETWRESWRASA